jgi:hypothetical protein
MGIVAGFLR